MKLFVYCMREFDEKPYFDQWCQQLGVEYGYTTEYPNMDNLYLAKGYDAITVLVVTMDAEMLRQLHEMGIKYISTRTIGYDHIDMEAARRYGIKVTNVTYPPSSVANYAIMMMLMCCRRMKQIFDRSIVQDFTLKEKLGVDISNCTVGIIGGGKIGSTVIKHLSGFGCRMLVNSPRQNEELAALAEYVDLDTLCRRSDIISLHVPENPQTHKMLDREAFAKMKDGVMIVNTARGALIDTDDMIEAIESGKIGAAALDVIDEENGLYYFDLMGKPIKNHHLAILRSFPNVIVTPHTAFYTDEDVSYMVINAVKGCLYHEQEGSNPFLVGDQELLIP